MTVIEKRPESDKRRPKARDRVYAKPCPECDSQDTYIYKTEKVVRRCKCHDCMATWSQLPAGFWERGS